MAPQIDNSHDWAVWLLDNLEVQQELAPGHIEGRLPTSWDFAETITAIDNVGQLIGMTDEAARTIEFYPQRVGVYASLEEMFAYPHNLRNVPQRFTLRNISFAFDALAVQHGEVPPQVENYFSAAKLCGLLSLVADMAANNGALQHFIKSPESRIEVKLSYQVEDLTSLPSLPFFEAEFAVTDKHQDQKRSIVRSVLLDAFKGKKSITVGEILQKFESLLENIRSSYSMYAAEFSFERIKAEVEKDNLDSTLKMNKTLSEIQNQLLAMPVALVLVGGQMAPDTGLGIKNVVVWLGACVFAGLMMLLIRNQHHAVDAIKEEIRLRKIKVDSQPDGIAGKFKPGFDELQKRALTQIRTLSILRSFVALSIVLATGLLVWYSNPDFHKASMAPTPSQAAGSATGIVQQPAVATIGTSAPAAPATPAAPAAPAAPTAPGASAAALPKSPVELAVQDMRAANATPPVSPASPAQKK